MTAPAFGEFWSLRHAGGGHLVTRHLSQRIGAICAWAAARLGLTPSQVTLLGTATFLGGASLFALGPKDLPSALACAALFQLGYGLDCADGQLARATGRSSAFGAWLDVACDHVRNIMLAAAVGLWLHRCGLGAAALLAGVAFAIGAAVQLHTATQLKAGAAAPASRRRMMATLVTAALDTATMLLVLAVLRPWPEALALATAGFGGGYFAIATWLAWRRLGPASSS